MTRRQSNSSHTGGPSLHRNRSSIAVSVTRCWLPYLSISKCGDRCYVHSPTDSLSSSLICDYCRNPFGGVRFLCLDCPTSDQKFWDTCDADDMACFANDINRGEDIKHHRPNHDFIKLRTVMNYRHLPDVYQNAWDSLAKARAFLAAVTPLTAEEAKALEARVSHEHDEADVNSSSIKAAHDELRTNGTNGVPHAESSDSEGHSDSENHPPLTGIFSLAVTINGAVKPHQDATNEVPHCTVCKKDVTIPCWFCTECPGEDMPVVLHPSQLTWTRTECFLCDSCEEKCQLPCVACSQPFVQPSWYYGGQPGEPPFASSSNSVY